MNDPASQSRRLFDHCVAGSPPFFTLFVHFLDQILIQLCAKIRPLYEDTELRYVCFEKVKDFSLRKESDMGTRRGIIVLLLAGIVVFGASPMIGAEEVSFQQFFDQVSDMDKTERRILVRNLTSEQRRSLHEQFRALPDAEREAAAEILLPHRNAEAKASKSRAIATIQYDSGVAHNFRSGSGQVVGNQFNTGFADPHTLTSVTVEINGSFGGVAVDIFGAPTGSSAPLLTSVAFSGSLNTPVVLPIPNATTPAPLTGLSGSFLAGVDQSGTFSVIDSTYNGVAVDINDAGFGFHGMVIDGGGGGGFNPAPLVCSAGTSVTTFSCTGSMVPFNTIIRMTGNSLPVELMSFTLQ